MTKKKNKTGSVDNKIVEILGDQLQVVEQINERNAAVPLRMQELGRLAHGENRISSITGENIEQNQQKGTVILYQFLYRMLLTQNSLPSRIVNATRDKQEKRNLLREIEKELDRNIEENSVYQISPEKKSAAAEEIYKILRTPSLN